MCRSFYTFPYVISYFLWDHFVLFPQPKIFQMKFSVFTFYLVKPRFRLCKLFCLLDDLTHLTPATAWVHFGFNIVNQVMLLSICDRMIFLANFIMTFIFIPTAIFIHLVIFVCKFLSNFAFLANMTCSVKGTALNISI
jgi:hypothetical protein